MHGEEKKNNLSVKVLTDFYWYALSSYTFSGETQKQQETRWLRTLHEDQVAVLEGFWCERKLLRKDENVLD